MSRPNADDRAGMAWWNGLTRQQRLDALAAAQHQLKINDVSAADAWRAHQERQHVTTND